MSVPTRKYYEALKMLFRGLARQGHGAPELSLVQDKAENNHFLYSGPKEIRKNLLTARFRQG